MLDRSKVRDIYAQAAALPVAERGAYLDRACASDQRLRAEVESLLAAIDSQPGFMAAPTKGGSGLSTSDAPGTRVGPYKLLEEIGRGGFGTVYLAEQDHPVRRRVALKIIKQGMDTQAVVSRFEAERQALAMMDHPHIAKVFDAGVTDPRQGGRPYFVMELVRGEPITAYADHAGLTIAERLDLFIQVCQALQHAHGKGVIHRDIKPGNVLVTTQDGRPHAKVIDFGIAKATEQRLTEKSFFTEFRQLIGTPEYMSPEQAGGAPDVDTRSDVYSLGVLLYELLTGATPFEPGTLRAAAYDEIQRIIREVDPPKPSTRLSRLATLANIAALRRTEPSRLGALVTGDLDWIVMRALDKDRARRYETASALAADISRHLAGEPVDAAPPSTGYRLRKFVRRHRVLVGAGSLIAAALVLGIAGTTIGLALAHENAARAGQEARRADLAAAEADRRREAAEYEGYIANIESASGALVQNDATRLRFRLDACPPELRNWEWRYLNAAADTSLLSMRHPRRNVQRVAISPDGERLATTSGDGKVRLWNAATGEEMGIFPAPESCIHDVEFSPNGKWVLAASRSGKVRVWDAATMAESAALAGHTAPLSRACFAAGGTRIVSASHDGTGRVWAWPAGKELAVLRGHEGPLTSAQATPDGTRLATASEDGSCRVWSVDTGEQILIVRGHAEAVRSVCWSPDASRLVTASDDATARVWDAVSGRELARFTHDTRALHATFSPDGATVLSCDWRHTPRLWEARTGKELLALRGHTHIVWNARFSTDGGRILTNSADNTVRLWDATSGEELTRLRGHIETPWTALFSPDGSRIVTGGDFTVRLWALSQASASLIAAPLADSDAVRTSPDQQSVLESGTGRVRLIHAPSGRVTPLFGRTDVVAGVIAFSPDGSRVVAAFKDNSVQVWDVGQGRTTLTLRGHDGGVRGISYSPDGSRIITASDDHSARVWDAATGAELLVLRGHTSNVLSAAFDSAGTRIATASDDTTVRIWDAGTGALIHSLDPFHNAAMHAAFSADGSRILTTGVEYNAKVWDTATGAHLFDLRGHEHVVYEGMFSPDGSRIVTCSFDGTARLWDAATGRQVLSLSGGVGGIHTARFTADGTRLLLGSTDGRAWFADSVPYRERFATQGAQAGR